MLVNKNLYELARAEWAFQFESLHAWLPTVVSILNREKLDFQKPETSAFAGFLNAQAKKLDTTEVLQGNVDEKVIGYVDAVGPLMKYSDWCNTGADRISSQLAYMLEDDNVKGIILNIDGPGGAVSGIAEFNKIAKAKNKPIVALVDLCASAHYWTACMVADHIMASNNISAQIGSVGVMVSFADSREMLEKQGYKFHEIYSDYSAHKNEAFKLARQGKYDLIKDEHLNPTAKKFQAAVRKARPNLIEEKGVLTGKTFEAEKALEYGMIDSIGSLKEAIELIDVLTELNY